MAYPKRKDDEIWFWWEHIQRCTKLEIAAGKYCKKYDLDVKTFHNMSCRIRYKSEGDPEHYKNICAIGREWEKSSLKRAEFCMVKGITLNAFTQIITHLKLVDAIARMEKERGDKQEPQMKFIQITPPSQPVVKPEEPEVIVPQNDIEIVIAKGVKVSISPNIDSMKIMKIIELLKDL